MNTTQSMQDAEVGIITTVQTNYIQGAYVDTSVYAYDTNGNTGQFALNEYLNAINAGQMSPAAQQVANMVGQLSETPYKVLAGAFYVETAVLGGGVLYDLGTGASLIADDAITDPLIANSDKVLEQTDLYHNFGELIGQEAMGSGEQAVQNGSYYQWNIQGYINGAEGTFEYGGTMSPLGNVLYVTHTFFAVF